MEKIPDDIGTAANVQAMVFGNMGDTSGTGVGFTRDPATGEKVFYGEFLMNAQGEDVVAGIRTPQPIADLEKVMPEAYKQLREITTSLEKHYRDMQDFEFTIEEGKLYMLQTRNGKRTGPAAVRIAVDMVEEGLITRRKRCCASRPHSSISCCTRSSIRRRSKKLTKLATGIAASPGAAVGRVAFTAEDAVEMAQERSGDPGPQGNHARRHSRHGRRQGHSDRGRRQVQPRGRGRARHGTALRRRRRRASASSERARRLHRRRSAARRSPSRKATGFRSTAPPATSIWARPRPMSPIRTRATSASSWSGPTSSAAISAFAPMPTSRAMPKSRAQFGAEGIGLCRTEHMFFAEDRIPHMQAMILARDEKTRSKALQKLLPMQRKDFAGLFKAMDGFPVVIRTLDPPLHEFLPKRENLMVDLARAAARRRQRRRRKCRRSYSIPVGELKKRLPELLQRVEELHEFNPMLGHRGCRLGITYPEITEMQARAIFEAAVQVAKKGIKVIPEVMIPLIGSVKELENQKDIVDARRQGSARRRPA